ncbi:MAG: C-GCAxxG-C-C family protein [Brevefilum sp.]|jgi:C_GCAxxG_C_C family probable redox protein
MNLENEAESYFSQHYNCAQSTFAPFARRFGMDMDLAMKIATPFGGGMGHAGQACGVVSGALMAIGLYRGITEYNQEKKYACYDLAKLFQERFKELHGELTCPGLLGLDIGDPVALEKARQQNVFNTVCHHFVADSVRIVADLLEIKD